MPVNANVIWTMNAYSLLQQRPMARMAAFGGVKVQDGGIARLAGITPLAFPEKDDCSIHLSNAELAAELEGRALP